MIEGEYSGPKLEDGKVTLEFMEHLMKTYKEQGKLHRRYAYKVGINWLSNSSPESFKMFCFIVYIFQYTCYVKTCTSLNTFPLLAGVDCHQLMGIYVINFRFSASVFSESLLRYFWEN